MALIQILPETLVLINSKQETQLALTNCVMCLEVSQGHQTWYNSIWYGFMLVCYSNFVREMHRFWDIWFQKCSDLENRVRGPSRSLEISSFDTAHTTFYWRSIVTMAVFVSFLRYSTLKNIVTLKSWSRVNQGHWKW